LTIRNIYIASIIIYLVTAIFSIGYYHPDEHHQLLEFAGLKLGINEAGDLPWEYQNRMRPALQVYVVVWTYSAFKFIGLYNPFLVATFLRIFSATISLLGIHLFVKAFSAKIESKKLQIIFILLSFLLWFNVFNNVRFSSENWSGTCFMIGFSLLHFTNWNKWKHFFIIGLVLGFSFVFRFQSGLLIFGLISWLIFIEKEFFRNLTPLLAGILCSGLAGVIADFFYYQEWTITFWNYLHQNIIQDKASGFGTDPWWYYFYESFIAGIPPFSLIFIASFLLVFIYNPKNILTWTFLPFLLVHFIVAHKEIRFLFPILAFVPLFITESLNVLQLKILKKNILQKKYYRIIVKSFLIVNFIALVIIAFKPAESNVSLYHSIYKMYEKPVILFSLEDNPYWGRTKINFYKRETLKIVKISDINELSLHSEKAKLIVTSDKELIIKLDQDQKLVYTALPEWIKKFNFNNWVERTRFWKVYEIKNN